MEDCGPLCGKRLAAALPETLRKSQQFQELPIRRDVRAKLLSISSVTIDRLLAFAKGRNVDAWRERQLDGFVVDRNSMMTYILIMSH